MGIHWILSQYPDATAELTDELVALVQ